MEVDPQHHPDAAAPRALSGWTHAEGPAPSQVSRVAATDRWDPDPTPRTPATAGEVPAHAGPGGAPNPGSPRRALLAVAVLLVAVLVGATVLLGSGGGGDDALTRRIASALEATGLDDSDARCVARRVVEEMGTEDLARVEDFTAADVPPGLREEFPEAFARAQTAAVFACGVTVGD